MSLRDPRVSGRIDRRVVDLSEPSRSGSEALTGEHLKEEAVAAAEATVVDRAPFGLVLPSPEDAAALLAEAKLTWLPDGSAGRSGSRNAD